MPSVIRRCRSRELLGWADILSIHTPLSDRTRGLIGKAELERMKPTALLSTWPAEASWTNRRWPKRWMRERLPGAVVDVFSKEPMPADNPLLHLRDPYRLLLSPHNAWSAAESIDTLVEAIAANIASYLKA